MKGMQPFNKIGIGGLNMLTKTNKTIWKIVWFGTLFCFMGFLFAVPCSAQKAPRGKAVIVSDNVFAMNGGDPHTAISGSWVQAGYLLHETLYKKTPEHVPFGLSQKVKSYKPVPGLGITVGLEYLELKE